MNKEIKARWVEALLSAAERVLESLHDDHQDCSICGQEDDYPHYDSFSCGELQKACQAARREWT